jgi:SAM-dependent methyltransferase
VSDINYAYWDRVSEKLREKGSYLDPFLGEMESRAYRGLIHRWAPLQPRGCVLKTDLFEEAVGIGLWHLDLEKAGGSIVGIDIAPEMAGQAKGHGVACVTAADVRQLPFKGGTFELIVSPSTLDHFKSRIDFRSSLTEIRRALSPGGRLIITLDNRDNIFDPLLRLCIRLGWTPYYIGPSYRRDVLIRELERAGFQVIETTAILHNPRLVAVGAVMLSNRIGWKFLTHLVRRAIVAAQRLEKSRWRYRTGSFIAALAIRPLHTGDE